MGLNDDEIQEIIETVEIIAQSESEELIERLVQFLNRLRAKYGDLPVILSTKADFIDHIPERIALYQRTIELADDPAYLVQSAESLAEIYIFELRNFEKAKHWFTTLESFVQEYGDEYLFYQLSDLRANMNRLLIRGV